MAGSYGAETTQGERYRLSFTVGGLLSPQGRALAEMYLNRMGGGSTERSSQTKVSEKISERSTKRATRVLTKKSANPLPRFANRPSRKTFLRFARIPRTGALWRKLLGGSVRSRLESLHIWQARIPPHPTARHLCGSRCADITQ